jgi:hypothetical protein
VITRTNARTLRYGRNRWVHNGDTWQVTGRHRDGSLTVRHLDHRSRRGGTVRLPADYVADSVELGYACTAHRAQGATVDTAHALVTAEMTREGIYVASTRGRESNRWYVASDEPATLDCDHEPDPPRTVHEVLTAVLRRTSAELSATQTIRTTNEDATRLATLVARYEHARDRAALDALRHAVTELPGLPETEEARILDDKAAPHLARVLADAVARGAHGPEVLQRAVDWDSSGHIDGRSPALVLATRITDHPRTLGIPDEPVGSAVTRPLPWLPAPSVGHPGWDPYLQSRAALIKGRAGELGSLAAAYREQYDIASMTTSPLGDPPQPGSRGETAYRAALAELATTFDTATPRPSAPSGMPTPSLTPQTLTRRPARQESHQLRR